MVQKIESEEVKLDRYGHTMSSVTLQNGETYCLILGGIENNLPISKIVASEKNELIKDRKVISTLFYNTSFNFFNFLKKKIF